MAGGRSMQARLRKVELSLAGATAKYCSTCRGDVPRMGMVVSPVAGSLVAVTSPFCIECGFPRDWLTGRPVGYPVPSAQPVHILVDCEDAVELAEIARQRAERCGDQESATRLQSELDRMSSGGDLDQGVLPSHVEELAEVWLGQSPPGGWPEYVGEGS